MSGLDRDLLAERRDHLAMADVLIAVGQGDMAFPWLMRAARITCELRLRGISLEGEPW